MFGVTGIRNAIERWRFRHGLPLRPRFRASSALLYHLHEYVFMSGDARIVVCRDDLPAIAPAESELARKVNLDAAFSQTLRELGRGTTDLRSGLGLTSVTRVGDAIEIRIVEVHRERVAQRRAAAQAAHYPAEADPPGMDNV